MERCRAMAVAVMLFMTVALSGCVDSDEPTLTMPHSSQLPPESKPAQMTVDIYWDATVSMQGFTTLAAGNIYRTLPDTLGELCGSLGETHFFRFGEQVTPIEGRDYLRFRDQACYTERITSFGNVLDATDSSHLSIVITDLFEDNADWSNVTQKLREKYFSQHLTVAIIGIKNSFYGEIFDVGLNATNFSYNSGNDPLRFRPFYLFLMGSESQVRTFMERWKEKIPSTNTKYVVFSEYLATYVADTQKIIKENLVSDGNLKKADSRLQEVHVVKSDKEAKFTIRGKLKKNDYCCLVNKNIEKSPQVKVFAWKEEEKYEEVGLIDKVSAWFDKDEDAEKNANSNNYTEVENGGWQEQKIRGVTASFLWSEDVDEDGNNCTLKLTFQPRVTLPWGQIALLQMQVVPSRENLQLPEWISEWDMGDIDATPEQFDGAKTINLTRIASSLKDSLVANAHPAIAELYLVIDERL